MGRRGTGHNSRWGITQLHAEDTYSLRDKEEYLNRIVKRANKAAGYDSAKTPESWTYSVSCCDKDFSGTVEAFTRSEARSSVKKEIGLSKNKRLPTNLVLEKSDGGNQ